MKPRSLVLAVLLLATGCGVDKGSSGEPPTTASTPTTTAPVVTTSTSTATKQPIRILALGDSYTIGQGVPEADRWPVQLARALEGAGWPFVDVDVVARTGWTTADLDRGIDTADPQGPYDLVTLLIGVNDQYQGVDPEQYRAGFAGLLERARRLSAGPLLVVSIPDWGATPFGSSRDPVAVAMEIDRFNQIGRQEAEGAGGVFVDITPLSRSDGPSFVAGDGLHPSRMQYAAWVDAILPAVVDLIGSR